MAACVAAIFTTILLTATAPEVLRDQDLLTAGFLLGMALVGTTVIAVALRRRPGRIEIGVGLGIATAWFMVLLRSGLAERSHLIEYGVVAVFVHAALGERRARGRGLPFPGLAAVALTTAIGAADEGLQALLPGRVGDLEDVLFDFLAATMSVVSASLLAWTRRRWPRSPAAKDHG